MKELSPWESTPLVVRVISAAVDSTVGVAVPPLTAGVSGLFLRFFADFDSGGTVPVVDIMTSLFCGLLMGFAPQAKCDKGF